MARSPSNSSRRGAELAAAVGWAHDEAMRIDLSRTLMSRIDAGQVMGLVLVRGYDGTPWNLTFGRLASLIQPHARYFVLDDEGKWRSKTLEDISQVVEAL